MSRPAYPRSSRLRHSRVLRGVSYHATVQIGKRLAKYVPLIFVPGYPKSGTTWACQMIGDYMQVPFPRWYLLPLAGEFIVHGHTTVSPKFERVVYTVRDGRDVMVSLYYFLGKRLPDGGPESFSPKQKRWFPAATSRDDVMQHIRTHLPAFVESQMRNPHSSDVTWAEHVETYVRAKAAPREGQRLTCLRYEDLRTDPIGAMTQAMTELTGTEADAERVQWSVEKYTFARQSGRSAGQEDRKNFLRKGAVGDWQNHFSREAAESFDRVCGETLVSFGYAPDRSWVQACPPLAEFASASD
ncbi:MAG: sulfotransferase domain-containing protein [Planctomycetota bacterium]